MAFKRLFGEDAEQSLTDKAKGKLNELVDIYLSNRQKIDDTVNAQLKDIFKKRHMENGMPEEVADKVAEQEVQKANEMMPMLEGMAMASPAIGLTTKALQAIKARNAMKLPVSQTEELSSEFLSQAPKKSPMLESTEDIAASTEKAIKESKPSNVETMQELEKAAKLTLTPEKLKKYNEMARDVNYGKNLVETDMITPSQEPGFATQPNVGEELEAIGKAKDLNVQELLKALAKQKVKP